MLQLKKFFYENSLKQQLNLERLPKILLLFTQEIYKIKCIYLKTDSTWVELTNPRLDKAQTQSSQSIDFLRSESVN